MRQFLVTFTPRHGPPVLINPLAVAYLRAKPDGVDPQTQQKIARTDIVFGAAANGLHSIAVDMGIDQVVAALEQPLGIEREPADEAPREARATTEVLAPDPVTRPGGRRGQKPAEPPAPAPAAESAEEPPPPPVEETTAQENAEDLRAQTEAE